MLKKLLLAAFLLNASIFSVFAYQFLSADQLQRIKTAKALLGATDSRTLTAAISELEKSPSAEGALEIYEAIAETYGELVKKHGLTDKKAQERLLDKIRMNMAYFQLGGPDVERASDSSLNIVIRRLLKKHLPAQLFSDRSFFKSLD